MYHVVVEADLLGHMFYSWKRARCISLNNANTMKHLHTTPVAREKSYSRFDLWEKVEASATLHGRIQNNNIEQLQRIQPSQHPHHLEHLRKMSNGNDVNRESPSLSQPGGDAPVTHPAAERPRVHDPQGSISRALNSAFPLTPVATDATAARDSSVGPGVNPGDTTPASPASSPKTTHDGDTSGPPTGPALDTDIPRFPPDDLVHPPLPRMHLFLR